MRQFTELEKICAARSLDLPTARRMAAEFLLCRESDLIETSCNHDTYEFFYTEDVERSVPFLVTITNPEYENT
jgi:hypothetical protein